MGGLGRPRLQEHTVTKILASLFVAMAVVFAPAAFAAEPAEPITLPAKPGNVTFDHKKHTAAGTKCTACHKDDKGGDIEGIGADMNKDKAHATCNECHKKEGKGPQKCADCHKKG
jgi:cytochrome c553